MIHAVTELRRVVAMIEIVPSILLLLPVCGRRHLVDYSATLGVRIKKLTLNPR